MPTAKTTDKTFAGTISFGAFRLTPATRSLTRDGVAVRLGGRAIELLIALAERAGQVLGKDELFKLVWPGAVVEESNLRVHIAAVRRALGDSRSGSRFILNVPGRGYSFVADVQLSPNRPITQEAQEPEDVEAFELARPPDLLSPLVGRDEVIARIQHSLQARRFVTITGTGGIGKTAVALAVAEQSAQHYPDGLIFVDLAPLDDASLLAAHIAAQLRLPTAQTHPINRIVSHLQARQLLLILDNCEHLVTAAADIAEAVLQSAPHVHVLATSREVLRAEGEWVERLTPLSTPPDGTRLTAAEVLTYPAVKLLVDRIRACIGAFEVTDEQAAILAEICARLDGLPLALELAATRVAAFGLGGVLEQLDKRFQLLTKGRRSAAPRHRDLTAMIDWSYESMPEDERQLWRRLSVFAGPFDGEAAAALVPPALQSRIELVDVLDRLFEKSMITLEAQGGEVTYRMLETLRLYAAGRLTDEGESRPTRRLHAEYFARLCAGSDASLIETPDRDWSRSHGRYLADIRAALTWAFGPEGDIDFAIAFTATSASYWFRLLLVPELRGHLEQALAAAATRPQVEPNVLLKLHIALAHALFHTLGPIDAVRDALNQALAIARAQGDIPAQLQILWAIFGNDSTKGDYALMTTSIAAVAALRDVGPPDIVEPLYQRISALGEHLLGNQPSAARHAELALNHPAVRGRASREGVFVYDHETATRSHQIRILWIQGHHDQALDVLHTTLERASRVDQPFAVGYFLVFGACPVAIWGGEWELARSLVQEIETVASGTPFNVWHLAADVYRRVLDHAVAPAAQAQALRRGLLDDASLTPFQRQSIATFDHRLFRPDCPLADLDSVNWSTAELWRASSELRLETDTRAGLHADVEATLLRALDLAQQQGAGAWRVRIATSLARLWAEDDNRLQGKELLSRTTTALSASRSSDMRKALSLLAELS